MRCFVSVIRRHWIVPTVVALAAGLAATTGCKGCGGDQSEDSTPDTSAPPEDTASAKSKDTVDTVAARDRADNRGFSAARRVVTKTKYVASEIESAEQETTSNQGGKPAPNPDPVPNNPEGNIDRAKLQEIFRNHQRQTRECYERQLKKNPNLSGRVLVSITIDSSGSVARINASGETLRNRAVNSCLEARIRRWNFPKPEGGAAQMTKPFNFKPQR